MYCNNVSPAPALRAAGLTYSQEIKPCSKNDVLQDGDTNHLSFLLENVTAASSDRALNAFVPAAEKELGIAMREPAKILKNCFADRTHGRLSEYAVPTELTVIWIPAAIKISLLRSWILPPRSAASNQGCAT